MYAYSTNKQRYVPYVFFKMRIVQKVANFTLDTNFCNRHNSKLSRLK